MARHRHRRPRLARGHIPLIAALESRIVLNGPSDVLMFHNDLSGSAANLNETQLTPQDVNPTGFGQLMSLSLDGYTYAQPLYDSNITLPDGTTHNIVFAATEHDSVYAFDADTGAQLWKDAFIDPANGITPVPGGANSVVETSDVVPEIGITGTPVIDPRTNRLFVVTKTQDPGPVAGTFSYVQQIHAIDITTGLEVLPPTTIGNTALNANGTYTNTTNVFVPGTAADGVNGQVYFNALREFQRPALVLNPADPSDPNGVVYVAFSSHGDNGPYHGWVLGYDAKTLQLVNEYNDTPDGSQSGIWESGSGPTIDAQGNLLLANGNGTMDAFPGPPSGGPISLGGAGGGLGYGQEPAGASNGIPDSVAIKFDAYKPSGNHSSTGLYVNGHRPDVTGALQPGDVYNDLAGTGIDFNAAAHASPQHTFTATLTYDGSTLTETIRDNTLAPAGLIDVSVGGTATASSNPTVATEAPAMAFDKLSTTKWLGTLDANGQATLQYQFASGNSAAVTQYKITSANDSPGRDPKSWQLQGSNDGSAWTTVDTQANQSFATRFATNTYTFNNTTRYAYYRLLITANNGSTETGLGGTGIVQLAELELDAPPAPSSFVDVSVGGTATASSNPTGAGEAPANAFDQNTATKWLGNIDANGQATLQYQFANGNGAAVTQYKITSANDSPGRDPKSWQLQGSNDGSAWTTVDTQANQSFATRFATNTYTFNNTTPYAYYRLLITANNGSTETQTGGNGIVQLAELELDAAAGGGGPQLGVTTFTYPNVNIPQQTGSNTAYVGFGGGTGGANSIQDVLSWTYTAGATSGTPTIDHSGGFVNHADLMNNGSATYAGSAARLTDGNGSEAGTIFTTTPVDDTKFTTSFTFAMRPGVTAGNIADGLTFIVQKAPFQSVTPPGPDYGEAVLKIKPAAPSSTGAPGISTVTDYFAPYTFRTLNSNDTDLGSGAVLLLPDLPGKHPHLAVETGKSGQIYLIDRDNMGGVNPNGTGPDNVYQSVKLGPQGIWSSPIFFNNAIYYQGASDVMRMVPLVYDFASQSIKLLADANGNAIDSSVSSDTFGYPGGHPSLSANGTQDGIVWALEYGGYATQAPEVLHAYDASDLSKEIYRSDQFTSSSIATGLGGPNNRDTAGGSVKFVSPTIANGHVYVPAEFELDVYGLFAPNTAPPKAPPASLTGMAIRGNQIQLAWTSNPGNATAIQVLRSTDNATFAPIATVGPTTTSFTDTVPNASTVFYYRLVALDQLGQSAPSSTLQIRSSAALPIVSVADIGPGLVSLVWTNAASDPTSTYLVERSSDNGATYTTLKSGLSATTTSFTDSTAVQGPTYLYRVTVINPLDRGVSNPVQAQIGPVTIDHSAGFITNNDLQANGSAIFSNQEQLVRLTQNYNQAGSVFTTQKVGDRAFHTTFSFRLHEGTQAAGIADGLTFTIQSDPRRSTALGNVGGDLGYGGITNSIAVKFDVFANTNEPSSSTTGVFLNGASPQGGGGLPGIGTSQDTLQYGINLRDQHTKMVDLSYDGTTLTETITDLLTGASHTFTYTVNIPAAVGDAGYAGITGAGGTTDYTLEDILNWKYTELDGSLPAPRAPSNLTVTNAASNAVSLRWDSNDAYTATGYSIERAPTPTFTAGVTVIGTIGPNFDTFTDNAPLAGSNFYRVRSFAGTPAVYSTYSNVIGVTLGATAIDHSAGFASNADLKANGNATFTGTVAQLTAAANNQVGSIFTTSLVDITHFTTTFTFQMVAGSANIADGTTFIIQGNNPSALGASGGGLGYQGIGNSVAIKFDAYKPSGNHSSTGLYVSGHTPGLPPLQSGDVYNDLAGSGIDFNAAAHASPPHTFQAMLTYDGTTLTEVLTDLTASPNVTKTFTYMVDIPSYVNGTIAYVGFGGATGGSNSSQRILTWTFGSGGTPSPTAADLIAAADPVPASDATVASDPVVSPAPPPAASNAAIPVSDTAMASDAVPGPSPVEAPGAIDLAAAAPPPTPDNSGAGTNAGVQRPPSRAVPVVVDSGGFSPVPTATKVKTILDDLDELAAALSG